MSESTWTRKVCKEMEDHGAVCVPLVASQMQRPGLPDRMVFHTDLKGIKLLEFKGERTPISKIQKYTIRLFNQKAPNCTYIVRYPNMVILPDGAVLTTFDGTGLGLLNTLRMLEA